METLSNYTTQSSVSVRSVKAAIYCYGYYSALHILRELEINEDYETCAVFKRAMEEVGIYILDKLSTKTDPVSMNETYVKVLEGCNNPRFIANKTEYLICEFKKLVFK